MAGMQLPRAPMLTTAARTTAIPAGWIVEPKWDGFRAFVGRWSDGHVAIRSRGGADLTTGFPEIAQAAAALPENIGEVLLDGELVCWENERLSFERLQPRLAAKPSTARRLAAAHPTNFVAFDLLHSGAHSLLKLPYRERRARLVDLFDDHRLAPPWTLCPATTDPATIMEWLTEWPRFGIEGLCMKSPDQAYKPGYRGWLKYRIRASTEGVTAAVTGSIEAPETLLLARLDEADRLRYVARTTPLTRKAAADLAPLLTSADDTHPWHEHRPRPRWNPPDPEDIILVAPDVVVEFSGDLAQDPRTGVFRHLVKFARPRPDLTSADTPPASTGREPAAW
jgi:ATP-dependent DNA ligase